MDIEFIRDNFKKRVKDAEQACDFLRHRVDLAKLDVEVFSKRQEEAEKELEELRRSYLFAEQQAQSDYEAFARNPWEVAAYAGDVSDLVDEVRPFKEDDFASGGQEEVTRVGVAVSSGNVPDPVFSEADENTLSALRSSEAQEWAGADTAAEAAAYASPEVQAFTETDPLGHPAEPKFLRDLPPRHGMLLPPKKEENTNEN